MIKARIKPFRAIPKNFGAKKVKAIPISGVEELSQIAEVGKVYEWEDNGRFFKVKVTNILADVKKGGIYVELEEQWQ